MSLLCLPMMRRRMRESSRTRPHGSTSLAAVLRRIVENNHREGSAAWNACRGVKNFAGVEAAGQVKGDCAIHAPISNMQNVI